MKKTYNIQIGLTGIYSGKAKIITSWVTESTLIFDLDLNTSPRDVGDKL